jgi:hypothetical protein
MFAARPQHSAESLCLSGERRIRFVRGCASNLKGALQISELSPAPRPENVIDDLSLGLRRSLYAIAHSARFRSASKLAPKLRDIENIADRDRLPIRPLA